MADLTTHKLDAANVTIPDSVRARARDLICRHCDDADDILAMLGLA